MIGVFKYKEKYIYYDIYKMPGGLLQLINYGQQDKFLINNPEITFFKIVYKQFSNFSFQDINIRFNNQVNFGNIHTTIIPKCGDLLQDLHLIIDLPSIQPEIDQNITLPDNYNVSLNHLNYILERLREIKNYLNSSNHLIYYPLDNHYLVNLYDWLDSNNNLVYDNNIQNIKWDYQSFGISNPSLISISDNYDNILSKLYSSLNYKYLKTDNVYQTLLKQFYYPLNLQYLLHILENFSSKQIITTKEFLDYFIIELKKFIIPNNELLLIKYLENKKIDYTSTTLDSYNYSVNNLINLKITLQSIFEFEPIFYIYQKTINNNNIEYNLKNILLKKDSLRSNDSYIINTQIYKNNYNILENDISNNKILNRLYFIASRPQIINSNDIQQIINIKYIKKRTIKNVINDPFKIEWNIETTTNPDEAIEWEIEIIGDPNEMNIIPSTDISSNPNNISSYNINLFAPNVGIDASIIEKNRNKYLVYIYTSIKPEDQDIVLSDGRFFTTNKQKKYFINASNDYVPINSYIYFPDIIDKNKQFLPVLNIKDLLAVNIEYNQKYFLDKSSNFIKIDDIGEDQNGNLFIIIYQNRKSYYIDKQGNNVLFTNIADISNNYIFDYSYDLVIDLLNTEQQDITINNYNDISNNLIPVINFVDSAFDFIYSGKYFNYQNIFYNEEYPLPSNLKDTFPYCSPFAIMEYQTSYKEKNSNYKIILKKINPQDISSDDLLYLTNELYINSQDISYNQISSNDYLIYGNSFFDLSNNLYTISNQEIFYNGSNIFYWYNNILIDSNNNKEYKTFEYWQENSIPSKITIDINNIINSKFINIDKFENQIINYDVYQNYKYIINQINGLNLKNYQIYKIITDNIINTTSYNINILKNIFNTIFNHNQFFSQYTKISSGSLVLQAYSISDHLTSYINSIFNNITIDNNYNLFINTFINKWSDFKEKEELIFFNTIKSINSNASSIIRVINNNKFIPLLKITINNSDSINIDINTFVDLNVNANIDTSNNINLIQNNKIKDFITNNNFYTNVNLNFLTSFNIIDRDYIDKIDMFQYTNNNFNLDSWKIIDSNITTTTIELYLLPPSYDEIKKSMYLFYLLDNQIINISNLKIFINDKLLSINSFEYLYTSNIDDTFVSNYDVYTSNDTIYLNFILIDFYRHVSKKIFNKLENTTTKSFELFFKVNLIEKLWHMLQDILYITKKVETTTSNDLSSLLLAINNFSVFFDSTIIIQLINDIFDNYIKLFIHNKIIEFLNNKTFLIKSDNIKFYNLEINPNYKPSLKDINLNNLKFFDLLQWFILLLAQKIDKYENSLINKDYLEKFKSIDIINNLTLNNINFFLYSAINESLIFNNDIELYSNTDYLLLKEIMYHLNELFLSIYTILNNENLNDTVNDTNFTLITNNIISNQFNNIYNLNNYTIYDIFTNLMSVYFKQIENNYEYNYILSYFNTTKTNFINYYDDIFNQISNIGYSSYSVFQEILSISNFNWNDYKKQLNYPRRNLYYDHINDYNLQYITKSYDYNKIYYSYQLSFLDIIIDYLNDYYIQKNDNELKNYNLYKNILDIDKYNELDIITFYKNTFGGNNINFNSNYEFRKAIEWFLYEEFISDLPQYTNYSLKIQNNALGFYLNSNKVGYYAESVIYHDNQIIYIINDYYVLNIIDKTLKYIINKNIIYDFVLTNYIINNNYILDSSNNIILSRVNNTFINITNNQVYTIDDIFIYLDNKLVYFIYENRLYSILNKIAIITNNYYYYQNIKYYIYNKVIYDDTNIISFQLTNKDSVFNKLKPNKIRNNNNMSISDQNKLTNFISNTLDNLFNKYTNIQEVLEYTTSQLDNKYYSLPILLNLILRNSLLPSYLPYEAIILSHILNQSNNITEIINTVKLYNTKNPTRQLQFWDEDNQKIYQLDNLPTNIINIKVVYLDRDLNKIINYYNNISPQAKNDIHLIDLSKNIIKKNLIDNIYKNKYIDNDLYHYGEFINQQELNKLNQDTSLNILSETLIYENGILKRLTDLPYHFYYDFSNNKVRYDSTFNEIDIVMFTSYYKWNKFLVEKYINDPTNIKRININELINNYELALTNDKFVIKNKLLLLANNSIDNFDNIDLRLWDGQPNNIYVVIPTSEINIITIYEGDYVIIKKNETYYGPMKILQIYNYVHNTIDKTLLKINSTNDFEFDDNSTYMIYLGYNNLNYTFPKIDWQQYYKQNYIPLTASIDIAFVIYMMANYISVINFNQIDFLVDINLINENIFNFIDTIISKSNSIPTSFIEYIDNNKNILNEINNNISYISGIYSVLPNLYNIYDNSNNLVDFITSFNNFHLYINKIKYPQILSTTSTILNFNNKLVDLSNFNNYYINTLTDLSNLKKAFNNLKTNIIFDVDIINRINNIELYIGNLNINDIDIYTAQLVSYFQIINNNLKQLTITDYNNINDISDNFINNVNNVNLFSNNIESLYMYPIIFNQINDLVSNINIANIELDKLKNISTAIDASYNEININNDLDYIIKQIQFINDSFLTNNVIQDLIIDLSYNVVEYKLIDNDNNIYDLSSNIYDSSGNFININYFILDKKYSYKDYITYIKNLGVDNIVDINNNIYNIDSSYNITDVSNNYYDLSYNVIYGENVIDQSYNIFFNYLTNNNITFDILKKDNYYIIENIILLFKEANNINEKLSNLINILDNLPDFNILTGYLLDTNFSFLNNLTKNIKGIINIIKSFPLINNLINDKNIYLSNSDISSNLITLSYNYDLFRSAVTSINLIFSNITTVNFINSLTFINTIISNINKNYNNIWIEFNQLTNIIIKDNSENTVIMNNLYDISNNNTLRSLNTTIGNNIANHIDLLNSYNSNTFNITNINTISTNIGNIKDYYNSLNGIKLTYRQVNVNTYDFYNYLNKINILTNLVEYINIIKNNSIILNDDNLLNFMNILIKYYKPISSVINTYSNLKILDEFIQDSSTLSSKLSNWLSNINNDHIFAICQDNNNLLEYNDYLYLTDASNSQIYGIMTINDILSVSYGTSNYVILELTWDTNKYNLKSLFDNYDPLNDNIYLKGGIGNILEISNYCNKLDSKAFIDIYSRYNDIPNYINIIDNNFYNIDFISDVTKYKYNILTNIINLIDDNNSLLLLPNNQINQLSYDNFRITNHLVNNNIEILNQIDNVINYQLYNYKQGLINTNILNNISTIPKLAWIDYIGHYIIDEIIIKIDDQILEKLTDDWIHLNSFLEITEGKINGYNKMIGNIRDLTSFNENIKKSYKLYIPLPFYFHKKPGLALPLIAMQNSSITISVKLKELDKLVITNPYVNIKLKSKLKMELYGSYVYLDGKERLLFGSKKHEYLIEQIQYQEEYINNNEFKLYLNNPIKDIFYYIQTTNNINNKQYWNYTFDDNIIKININFVFKNKFNFNLTFPLNILHPDDINSLINTYDYSSLTFEEELIVRKHSLELFNNIINQYNIDNFENPISSMDLYLNGHKRCRDVDGIFTSLVYPNQVYKKNLPIGMNVYPFCLYPLDYQPSGACNFTYFNDKKININLINQNYDGKIKIIARSYNILRIISGIACIAM